MVNIFKACITTLFHLINFPKNDKIDAKEDLIGIQADCIWQTVAALDCIKQCYTKPNEPIKLFVQLRDAGKKEEPRQLENID